MAVRRALKRDLNALLKLLKQLFCQPCPIWKMKKPLRLLVGTSRRGSTGDNCDGELILIKNTKAYTTVSVILCGSNDFLCDQMECPLHDALCVEKRVLESKSVVPGGDAVEAALSVYLKTYTTSMGSLCYRTGGLALSWSA